MRIFRLRAAFELGSRVKPGNDEEEAVIYRKTFLALHIASSALCL